MNLILNDGTTYSIENNSTVGAFRIPVETFAEVDVIRRQMTAENLHKVTLGVIEYHDVINESVQVQMADSGEIVAIFLNRMSTEDIVQDAIDSYTYDLIEGGIL